MKKVCLINKVITFVWWFVIVNVTGKRSKYQYFCKAKYNVKGNSVSVIASVRS